MSDLSQDELTVLMIAVHGESMMAIGRWQKPIERLLQKGYMQSRGGDNFNCIITPAGRAACEARDAQDQDDFVNAFRKVAQMERPHSRPPGPYVVQGKLFFQMPNGNSISCTCIGEPYASQIAALWGARDA